jgi:two-component system, LytTR family, response regulator AlgR
VKRGDPGAAALQKLVPEGRRQLRSTERGRVILISIDDVLFFRAEQKYVTARTATAEHLLEDSLLQLESEFGERFVRVHRNCLVAPTVIAGYERAADQEGDAEPHWQLLLRGVDDKIPVSRRQWPIVKALIKS